MNVYFMSQFGYSPLVRMTHSRTLNKRINGLHKRSVSLVYQDYSSSFSELLEKERSVTIHHRNLKILAYEIFKVINNLKYRQKYFLTRRAIIVLEVVSIEK